MIDPGGIAKKSVSFDLVDAELKLTIDQAEQSLERFHENRESGEELQNCIDFLHQLRGIFVLIELNGAILLANEAVALANEVPVSAQASKDNVLTALNQLLFVLRRYVEYFRKRREDHPELLIELVNEYRRIRDASPLPESHFFEYDPLKLTESKAVQNVDQDIFVKRARRLRHLYQVGLLTLLRKTVYEDIDVGSKLLMRSAEGMTKISDGSTSNSFWRLLALAAPSVITLGPLSVSRKQLLMQIERNFKEAATTGSLSTSKPAADNVVKELLHWIARDGHRSEQASEELQSYGADKPDILDSHSFLAHREMLMGPGADVLASVAVALQEEINLIKDKLDMIERGMDNDELGLNQIVDSFGRLGHTLEMLSLPKLGQVTGHIGVRLSALQSGSASGTLQLVPGSCEYKELTSVADGLLVVEQAILMMERGGLTIETDRLADQLVHRGGEDTGRSGITPYFQNAHDVVVDEAKSGLLLAKKSITAFLESGGDRLHLANVPDTLDTIRGALTMLEHRKAAGVVSSTIRCISSRFLSDNTDEGTQKNDAEDGHFLETLADALTSLEYFVDSLARSTRGNMELLDFAADSLNELGFEVV